VMDALRASKVREVHVIGRRGPAQAKFTTKELRELGDLPGVHVSEDPAELDLAGGYDRSGESEALATSDRRVRGNLVAMARWGDEPGTVSVDEGGRKLRLRFWLRPAEIQGSSSAAVAGLRLERTRLTDGGVFEGTGEFETLDAQLVLRSVVYQSVPLPGVPFDARTCTVPNASGRVLSETGEPLPGEYVAGWLKRGPTGVIGTNKGDAAETVQALLADLAGGPDLTEGKLPRPGLLRRPESGELPEPEAPAGGAVARSALAPVLADRGVIPVSYADWLRISAAEEDLAASLGRGDRVKLPSRDAIWDATRRLRYASLTLRSV
jgi:ferredoxin--NADP+ reductase